MGESLIGCKEGPSFTHGVLRLQRRWGYRKRAGHQLFETEFHDSLVEAIGRGAISPFYQLEYF